MMIPKPNPKLGMRATERVINKGVVALMGVYPSAVGFACSQIAEKHKVPYINQWSTSDKITARGFRYLFSLNGKASWYARDHVAFLSWLRDEKKIKVNTVALLFEDTLWGQTYKAGMIEHLNKNGFKVVVDQSFPASVTDITPTLTKIKSINPDILIPGGYDSDAILTVKTMQEIDYNANMVAASAGYISAAYVKELGKRADYSYSTIEWIDDLKKPFVKEATQNMMKRYNTAMLSHAAGTYSCTYVLADALERAGSTDRDAIRDALTKTKITGGPPLIMPYKAIEFDEAGQNIHARILVGLLLDGKWKTVWPEEYASQKLVWPVPKWKERK